MEGQDMVMSDAKKVLLRKIFLKEQHKMIIMQEILDMENQLKEIERQEFGPGQEG